MALQARTDKTDRRTDRRTQWLTRPPAKIAYSNSSCCSDSNNKY